MTTSSGFVVSAAAALALCAIGVSASAQPVDPSTSSFLRQDAPFVATPQALVERMLDMAKVTPDDYVIDLGSGDGRIVIAAARRGARALGVEASRNLIDQSRRSAEQQGVGARAEFRQQDLFETDLSRATVITMYLLPEMILRLRPKFLALPPGTRVVSTVYDMGDWIADEMSALRPGDGCDTSWCTALLWIVPAQVAGTHRTTQGELALTQTYQKLSGTLRTEGSSVAVEGKVIGRQVVLTAGGRQLRGRMEDRRLVLE